MQSIIHALLALVFIATGNVPYSSLYAAVATTAGSSATAVSGDLTISGAFGGSTIVVKTSTKFAGAISSLTWDGKEFVNATDHGRELQAASSFDDLGECWNPTEAGSSQDKNTSSSKVLQASASGNVLHTLSQMAFWLRPGEHVHGYSYCNNNSALGGTARNTTALSTHLLEKTITIGFQGIPNVIEHDINFYVTEPHTSAQFEAPTFYSPASFSSFFSYNPSTHHIEPISEISRYGNAPFIMATSDGKYATGVYAPSDPGGDPTTSVFGYYSLKVPGVTNKWSCVFRENNLAAGDHSFRCFTIIGTLEDVKSGIDALYNHFGKPIIDEPPVGKVDEVNTAGVIKGWTVDPNTGTIPVAVRIYLDGPAGRGGTPVTTVTANATSTSNPSFWQVAGYNNGNHGFNYVLPVNIPDGHHTVYVYALNTAGPGTGNTLLTPSPVTVTLARTIPAASCIFNGTVVASGQSVTAYQTSSVPAGSTCVSQQRTCTNGVLSGSYTNAACSISPASTSTPPVSVVNKYDTVGFLDVFNATGGISGWSLDSDSATSFVTVRFYLDGPKGTGQLSTTAIANIPRPDVTRVTGFAGNHGFTVTLPTSVPNGVHTIYAYGLDTLTGKEKALSGSPKKVTLQRGSQPITSCTLNGTTVANSHSVTAYQSSSVPAGSTCVSQQRTCINGVLSGSYTNAACSVVVAPPSNSITATASRSLSSNPPSNTLDNNAATIWNAGTNGKQWIEFDLGSNKTLKGMSLTVVQTPAGMTTHQIYAGTSPHPTTLVRTLSGTTKNGDILHATFSPALHVRYVRVATTKSPSWIAWGTITFDTSKQAAADDDTFANADGNNFFADVPLHMSDTTTNSLFGNAWAAFESALQTLFSDGQ